MTDLKGKVPERKQAANEFDDARSSGDSSFDEADDQDWADWVDDDEQGQQQPLQPGLSYSGNDKSGISAGSQVGFKVPTLALFPEGGNNKLQTLGDAMAALAHAASLGCDLVEVVHRLQLDAIATIRLLNHLRRHPGSLTPVQVAALQGSEPFLSDDAELKPVPGAENDGLLQIDFDELIEERIATGGSFGTDAKSGVSRPAGVRASEGSAALRKRVEDLEQQLVATQMAYAELQERSLAQLGVDETHASEGCSTLAGQRITPLVATGAALPRDDDTHYFESYASNDIHQTMISDTARTLSYARFILSPANAHLFRGKRVMDVGCGSGILSLFAARAGADLVVAIDASDVATRATQNVRENGFDKVIKVVRGKVEDLKEELKPYEGKIDVIISEWMGYFLLYESMLPSVLHARDLYLRRTTTPENPFPGLLAPSHCRMTLAAVSDVELLHERVHFWNDVHGFKMTAMTKGLFDEAYTECLKPEAVVTDIADIYDLPLCVLPPKQPTFRSPFRLTSKRCAAIHGFVSWFDTWFMTSPAPYRVDSETNVPVQLQGGERLGDLPPCTTDVITVEDVPALKLKGSDLAPSPASDSTEAKGEVVSFTTGPYGKDTHWKQTVFLLKEPIDAEEGSVISGEIIVTQSESNSRELEVELHYMLEDAVSVVTTSTTTTSEAAATPVGKGVKMVQAKMVQLFKVR
ncbi:S-adenosyl-L-methionine-dependent methyltransferase [Tilletiaria anomala UBC 951]|uniref:type I protein arginine methyltransferase n=1 Tax=Tilletiaria anomala (strain ATCC 24038 / CBS 436.72 / UBC 951) TaxID=1037660 RepID=A0A066VX93_TILAU|nr:S-adenosyl-L-methionine-dependent methyltransferase [Tilletiaria anomala UBC 951]KDN46121.1 S-adenosyl-L-methionine-dependent methyltransferase [Tilletiaria anomala UBC 951]